MLPSRLQYFFFSASLLAAGTTHAAITDIGSVSAGGGVSQLIYAPNYNTLLTRNSASAIRVLDASTGSTRMLQLANGSFTDFDLTQSGRYVYAADSSGQNIGYSKPLGQDYVHRYDLATNTWEMKKTTGVAVRIEAVNDAEFIASSTDQWITITDNDWGTTGTVNTLGSTSWGVYSGNIAYDVDHRRLIHSDSGISTHYVTAYRLNDAHQFARQEQATNGGYASGFAVLSTDNSSFYDGARQLDALDVTYQKRLFPESILAASGTLAVSANKVYDANSGVTLAVLGFTTNAVAFNPNGNDFWAFNANDGRLHHFADPAAVPLPGSFGLMLSALTGFAAVASKRRRH